MDVQPSHNTEVGSQDVYYAAADAETCVSMVLSYIEDQKNVRRADGTSASILQDWWMYYQRDEGRANPADGLYPYGDEFEKVRLRVNVAHQLIRHVLTLLTSTRPSIDPKAKNSDSKSIKMAEVVGAIADEYLRTKKLSKFIFRAVEHALVTPAGFLWIDWDAYGGDLFTKAGVGEVPPGVPALLSGQLDADGNSMMNLYKGDFCFNAPNMLDVFWDHTAKSWEELQAMSARKRMNKFDLVKLYPDQEDHILNQPPASAATEPYDRLPIPLQRMAYNDVNVEVWFWYHKRCPALPDGRRMMFLRDGTVLEDGPLEFSRIPILRIVREEVIGTSLGWGLMNEIRPMQELLHDLHSSAATNLKAFAVPQIMVDADCGIEAPQMSGGMGVIPVTGLAESARPPVMPLELLSIKAEFFKYMETVTAQLTQSAGLNEIVLGRPPAGLNAGVAINLFQSMAYQAQSPLEGQYAEMIEDAIMIIIEGLKNHPDIPRTVRLAGASKMSAIQEFYGSDLEDLDRVEVDLGNPMSRTVAGRMQLLQSLRETGVEISAEQAVGVLNHGNLDAATEGVEHELQLIRDENELMAQAQMQPMPPTDPSVPFAPVPGPDGSQQFLWGIPPVRKGDNHPLHLREHRVDSADIRLRANPAVAQALDMHEMMHVQMHLQGDVVLGIAMGQIPPGIMGQPAGMPTPPGQPPPPGAQQQRPPQPPPARPAPPMRPPPPKAQDPGQQAMSSLEPPQLAKLGPGQPVPQG